MAKTLDDNFAGNAMCNDAEDMRTILVTCNFSGLQFPVSGVMQIASANVHWLHPMLTAQMPRNAEQRLSIAQCVAIRTFKLVQKGYITWCKPFAFHKYPSAQLTILHEMLYKLDHMPDLHNKANAKVNLPKYAHERDCNGVSLINYLDALQESYQSGFIVTAKSGELVSTIASIEERRAAVRDEVYHRMQTRAYKNKSIKIALEWLCDFLEKYHVEWEFSHTQILQTAILKNAAYPARILTEIKHMLLECTFPLHESAKRHYEHMLILQAIDARLIEVLSNDALHEKAENILAEMCDAIESEQVAPKQTAKFALMEITQAYTKELFGNTVAIDAKNLGKATTMLERAVENAAAQILDLQIAGKDKLLDSDKSDAPTQSLKGAMKAFSNLRKAKSEASK